MLAVLGQERVERPVEAEGVERTEVQLEGVPGVLKLLLERVGDGAPQNA